MNYNKNRLYISREIQKEHKTMWHEISNQTEADKFMEDFFALHDSCIKELKFISGAYVDNNLSMHPINDKRILKVLIQRQFKPDSTIEFGFIGLKNLKYEPYDEEYTCEIFSSTLTFKDGLVWWWLDESPKDSCIVISALKLRWRSFEGKMGKDDFYVES